MSRVQCAVNLSSSPPSSTSSVSVVVRVVVGLSRSACASCWCRDRPHAHIGTGGDVVVLFVWFGSTVPVNITQKVTTFGRAASRNWIVVVGIDCSAFAGGKFVLVVTSEQRYRDLVVGVHELLDLDVAVGWRKRLS